MQETVFWDKQQRWPTIRLIVGDITTQTVDAVVSGVQPNFVLGGGVGVAINRVAGPELAAATAQIGSCQLGQSVITYAFNLPAKYVIHTACPLYNEAGTNDTVLASCYSSALDLALQYQLQTISFPSLATGMFGFPHEVAAGIACRAIRNLIFERNGVPFTIKEVTFTVFQSDKYEIYAKKFSEIFIQ